MSKDYYPLCHRKLISLVRKQVIFAFLCLFATIPAYATSHSVLVIFNNDFAIHKQAIRHIKQQFSKQQTLVEYLHFQNISQKQIEKNSASLIIALGSKSAQIASPSSKPVLMALVSENSLQSTDSCYLNNCPESKALSNMHYVIYLDQPISRQLNFLSLLLPEAKNIGLLTAAFSEKKITPLNQETAKRNLSLHNHFIFNERELNRELRSLMEKIDVLLTVPDPLIHNRTNLPFLLLSTYRYNIPVIGFSKAYVKAGAIAAVYSSPEQISQQIFELANQIIITPKTVKSRHFSPKYFSIAINQSVAHSLGLRIADKQILKSKLLTLEE